MRKYFLLPFTYLFYFLLVITCYFNLPIICAYLIRISLFKPKFFRKKIKGKKIFIVLYREIGVRDIEIIYKSSNFNLEFFFMRRSIPKLIFFCFSNKKKFFFNYLKPTLNKKWEDLVPAPLSVPDKK